MLALLTVAMPPLFWVFVAAFNLVDGRSGSDYYHATQVGLPALAGLALAYAIPILVPLLMITHVTAFYLLLRSQPRAVSALATAS